MLQRNKPFPTSRHLCSEMVSILCTSGAEPGAPIPANLEEIGQSSAQVLADSPIRAGVRVWITCEMHQLKGRVKSCTFRRMLGYFIEVALDPDSCWSPMWFTPKHLLRVFGRIADKPSKYLYLRNASGS
jgi:hypothetical protein